MKRRLCKKRHAQVLFDLAEAISLAPEWRRRLFAAEPGRALHIDRDHLEHLPARLRGAITAANLRFEVCRAPEDLATGDDGVVFVFGACGFRTLRAYSWNNPEVVEY